ncbi:DUF2306 domain-containing protein [Paenibacillus agricola]|uniref:DUF2306 domain-containing protein n=1 Tax=Paenibacillus agricola TaxID=2716264 RepID=A0ABX0J2E3_9BACL|nr:DUF2306 domain-containing protein [Paenibacillus agricola]NHN30434.1 DUF2306 domain-containing protein [Paenibacillus agricola]
MNVFKGKYLYALMVAISLIYIIYVTYTNLLYDPQAADFLSHKTNLKRPIPVPAWANVMHIHVIAACLAMVAGALNFSSTLLRKYRLFHRINGYLYVLCVFIVVVTSGYMAPYTTGGKINSIPFNLVNILWFGMTITALVQIKRKQVNKHWKWMVRSYAFCFTNMFIHLISFVLHDGFGIPYTLSYTIGVYGAILLNIIGAELVIRFIYKIPLAPIMAAKT